MKGTTHPGDLLSALLDGELDPGTEQDVERHLAGCGPCRQELVAIDEARRRLRHAGPVPAPPGLVAGVIDRRHRANRRGTGLALLAAAVAAVVGLAAADPVPSVAPPSGATSGDEVALELRPRRDRPSGIRRAAPAAASQASLGDRAVEAARELLDFFG